MAYEYYAIVYTKTRKVHNVQEIIELNISILDGKTLLQTHSFHSHVKPRILFKGVDNYMDDTFDKVVAKFNEKFEWLNTANVLYITIGNQTLLSYIPGQLLIEDAHTVNPVEHFGPRTWCNLLWVFERVTRVRLQIDNRYSELHNMRKHWGLPATWVDNTTDYCDAIAEVVRVMLAKTPALVLKPTCHLRYDDTLQMMTSDDFNLTFVRM